MDDAARGAARSRLYRLPVLKLPSPTHRKLVSNPGSCSGVWICEDGKTVLKAPLAFHLDGCDEKAQMKYLAEERESSQLIQREKDIYERIGKHGGILGCLDITNAGLIFPFYKNGNLRHFLHNTETTIALGTKLDWVRTALGSVHHLHTKGILQADVSARNVLVADDLSIVLCDFAGFAMGAHGNMVRPETRYQKVDGVKPLNISVDTEIFAVGSLIYEIISGTRPYDDVDDDEVESLFQRHELPDTAGMHLGHIVRRCWAGDFKSVEEISRAVSDKWKGDSI